MKISHFPSKSNLNLKNDINIIIIIYKSIKKFNVWLHQIDDICILNVCQK